MKQLLIINFCIFFIIVLSGCAGVKVYQDAELTKQTGVKFYNAKPFLLIEKNPAKDVALKSTIIYLPDLGTPYYAKMISGLGSNDLKLAFENGSISSYGVVTDSKVPETITSLAGLVTGYGGAVKSIAEAAKVSESDKEDTKHSISVDDIRKALDVINDVVKDVKALENDKDFKAVTTSGQKTIRSDLNNVLNTTVTLLNKRDPEVVSEIITKLKSSQKLLEAIKSNDKTTASAVSYNSKITTLHAEIGKAIEILQPTSKQESVFELYEIQAKDGIFSLKRVNFQ